MKKIFAAVVLLCAIPLSARTITLSLDVEKGSDGYRKAEAVFTELFRRAGGHSVAFVRLPSERALVEADQGIIDGDAFRFRGTTSNYKNLFEISEPIITNEIAVFLRKEDANRITLDRVKDFSVIYIIGHKEAEKIILDAGFRNINPASDMDLALKMLRRKRADIIIAMESAVEVTIGKNRDTDIIRLKEPLYRGSLHLVLNKKNKDLEPSLNRVLAEMKKDGTIG